MTEPFATFDLLACYGTDFVSRAISYGNPRSQMPITVEQKWQGAQVDNETITSEYVSCPTCSEDVQLATSVWLKGCVCLKTEHYCFVRKCSNCVRRWYCVTLLLLLAG